MLQQLSRPSTQLKPEIKVDYRGIKSGQVHYCIHSIKSNLHLHILHRIPGDNFHLDMVSSLAEDWGNRLRYNGRFLSIKKNFK